MFLAFSGYPYLLYRWWPMFFVGAFLGEQIKSLQGRLKECRTNPVSEETCAPEEVEQVVEEKDFNVSDSTLDVDKSYQEDKADVLA
jgi:hypothetical protein